MNKRNLIILSFVVILVTAGLTYYFYYHYTSKSQIQNNITTEVDTARTVPSISKNETYDALKTPLTKHPKFGYYGTVTLTGYLEIKQYICNPGDPCNGTIDYANLVFTKSDNQNIYDFLSEDQDDRVSLGCYEKEENQISYISYEDVDPEYDGEYQGERVIEGKISGKDFTKLFSSSISEQVELKLTRPIYTSGHGAPNCFTPFAHFDVL